MSQPPNMFPSRADDICPARLPVYGALDLGTNNCRLLLARPALSYRGNVRSLQTVDSFSRIVRLGAQVSSTGILQDDAIERSIQALDICARKIARQPLARIRCVTTEAARRAANAQSFLEQVKARTGIDLEIITTEEEARLALLGCSLLLRPDARYALAFDIGGGSTEVMWVEICQSEKADIPNLRVIDWVSLPYGVMNLSESMGNVRYVDLYFQDLVKKITDGLKEFEARHTIRAIAAQHNVQMLSTSGTVTTLAAIHMGLQRYDRTRVDGTTMRVEALLHTIHTLLQMRPSERFYHPCIGAERNDYILAGCAIFAALANTWPFESLTVADRGVREGIIVSMMQEAIVP